MLAQIDTMLFLNVILWVIYSAALTSYYANRSRPGFTLPPSLAAAVANPAKTAVKKASVGDATIKRVNNVGS